MNSSTTRSTWGATKAGRRGPALWAPALAIGVLTAGVVGGLTYVFSPSQTPALLALDLGNVWIYWVGDVLGGAAAAGLYMSVFS